MWDTKEEDIAEQKRKAQDRKEDQRRKMALHGQMHPQLQGNTHNGATASHPVLSAKVRKRLQASVENDTKDNSPETDTTQRLPCNDPHKDARQNCDSCSPVPHTKSEKSDTPLCLEKRVGVYSCAPPSEFAREEVATSTLKLRAPEPNTTARRAPRHKRNKSIAVWSGDEVRIIDGEISPMCLSHEQRPHRCAY